MTEVRRPGQARRPSAYGKSPSTACASRPARFPPSDHLKGASVIIDAQETREHAQAGESVRMGGGGGESVIGRGKTVGRQA